MNTTPPTPFNRPETKVEIIRPMPDASLTTRQHAERLLDALSPADALRLLALLTRRTADRLAHPTYTRQAAVMLETTAAWVGANPSEPT